MEDFSGSGGVEQDLNVAVNALPVRVVVNHTADCLKRFDTLLETYPTQTSGEE